MHDSFDFYARLYVLGDPQTLSNCGASDMFQSSVMAGWQILLRDGKTPGESTIQGGLIQLGKVASFEKMSFRMNYKTDYYLCK